MLKSGHHNFRRLSFSRRSATDTNHEKATCRRVHWQSGWTVAVNYYSPALQFCEWMQKSGTDAMERWREGVVVCTTSTWLPRNKDSGMRGWGFFVYRQNGT